MICGQRDHVLPHAVHADNFVVVGAVQLRRPRLRPRGHAHRLPRRSRPGRGPGGELSPQFTAFFTSRAIFASAAAVNSFSAKEVGHMVPSSRFAASLKPNVPYRVLNFSALWKKQTTRSLHQFH